MSCYHQALAQDPRRASSHRLIGHILQHCGRLDEAARYYEAARHCSPMTRGSMPTLAAWRSPRGTMTLGAALFRAVNADPTFAQGHQGRAQALLELGQLDEAETGFNTAIQLDPALATSWVGLARLQAERGDLDLACQSRGPRSSTSLVRPMPSGDWRSP